MSKEQSVETGQNGKKYYAQLNHSQPLDIWSGGVLFIRLV